MKRFLERISSYWKPHRGQLEYLMSNAKLRVLACGRRWGKTDAAAAMVVRTLTLDAPAKVLIVAPSLWQARLLFDRVVEMAARVLTLTQKPRYRPNPVLTHECHEVSARSGLNPHLLRGGEATHVIVDEAAFVHDRLIEDALNPMLATTDGEMSLMSTPNGYNAFHSQFEAAGSRKEYWRRQAPSNENPRVSPLFLERQRETVSQRTYAVEYEAQFMEPVGAVFRAEALTACEVDEVSQIGPISIGIDWGRKQDWTALVVLSGTLQMAHVLEIHRVIGSGFLTQSESLASVIARYPRAVILCDETGIGDPAIEIARMVMPGRSMKGYRFEQRSKAELVDRLVSLVERGALKFRHDPLIIREMRAMRWKNGRADGHGEHDDVVMAMGLAAMGLSRAYGAGLVQLGEPLRF